jgi:anti-sigma regulatory factor (Ser/Thr protein kinase)
MSPGAIDDPGLQIYERVLPALAGSATQIRSELMQTLAQHDCAADRRADIALVISEAATNAVLHAYGDTTGPLYVAATLGGQSLTVWICDIGSGMLPGRDSPGLGLGLGLITKLCDEVLISSDADAGTCVTATFERVARRPALGGPHRTPTPGSARREVLVDYLHALRAAHTALEQDTDAVLAQADLAVARARSLRHQHAHHRSARNTA